MPKITFRTHPDVLSQLASETREKLLENVETIVKGHYPASATIEYEWVESANQPSTLSITMTYQVREHGYNGDTDMTCLMDIVTAFCYGTLEDSLRTAVSFVCITIMPTDITVDHPPSLTVAL